MVGWGGGSDGWGGGSEVWGKGRWEGVKCIEGGSDVWEGGLVEHQMHQKV